MHCSVRWSLSAKDQTVTDYKLRNIHCNYILPQCNLMFFAFICQLVSFYVVTFVCVIVIALYYFYCIHARLLSDFE